MTIDLCMDSQLLMMTAHSIFAKLIEAAKDTILLIWSQTST